jgi:hypothetical protein
VTENEPFNLAFKLDNTNSDSKAVYNVDTRAITITGSSGGQSFSFPFDVVDQTQTANGKTVRLQLVAVKPSSDPRVVFLVKAPTKWETSAVGDRRQDRRSGLGDDGDNAQGITSYSQVVERKFVVFFNKRILAPDLDTSPPPAPTVIVPIEPDVKTPVSTNSNTNTGNNADVSEPETSCIARRTFVIGLALQGVGIFSTQVFIALLVVWCMMRTFKMPEDVRMQSMLEQDRLKSTFGIDDDVGIHAVDLVTAEI